MICTSAGSPAIARSSQPRQAVASSTYPWFIEHGEGERGVPQPDVAVVPVARAAELLGQARRRGGRDAARVLVREGAQHGERPDDLVVVLPLVADAARPRVPPRLGGGQRARRRPARAAPPGRRGTRSGRRRPSRPPPPRTCRGGTRPARFRRGPRTITASGPAVAMMPWRRLAAAPAAPTARPARSRTGSARPGASPPCR